MPAPGYAWTCVNCGSKNGAESECCEACTLPARFTARQLAQMKQSKLPEESAYDAKVFGDLMMFFPEGLIALFCIICAPVWSFELLEKGRIVAAIGLLLAAAIAIGGVYVAIVEKSKWLAYAAIVAYLLCVGCIFN